LNKNVAADDSIIDFANECQKRKAEEEIRDDAEGKG